MGTPEEDKSPAWLRDYGENSGHLKTDATWGYQRESGTFAVDLRGLKDFGTKLKTELELDYVPHVKTAKEDMSAKPTVLPSGFYELVDVVRHQSGKLQEVLESLTAHYVAVQTIATFATELAVKYGNTDALAATGVAEVEKGLATTPAAITTLPKTPIDTATTPANTQPEPTGGPRQW